MSRDSSCASAYGEVAMLRARVASLEAALLRHEGGATSIRAAWHAQTNASEPYLQALPPPPRVSQPSPPPSVNHGRRLFASNSYVSASRNQSRHACGDMQKWPNTNLERLLPSMPNSDLSRHGGRCSRRYEDFETAWAACLAETACVGVVRDNGLRCQRQRARRRQSSGGRGVLMSFELRGGNLRSGPGAAWVCPRRLQGVEEADSGLLAAPDRESWASAVPAEGYVLIAFGPCSLPDGGCLFLREAREAIRALRSVDNSRPIAVLSDGAIAASELLALLGCDLVKTVSDAAARRVGHKGSGGSGGSGGDKGEEASWRARVAMAARVTGDHRVRKLLAYGESPFQRTVFLDGDTCVT